MALLPPDVNIRDLPLDKNEKNLLNQHADLCSRLASISFILDTNSRVLRNLLTPQQQQLLKYEEDLAEWWNQVEWIRAHTIGGPEGPMLDPDAPPYQYLPRIGNTLDKVMNQQFTAISQQLKTMSNFLAFIHDTFCGPLFNK